MTQPKGKIPSHIRPKAFHHPQDAHPLIRTLMIIEEPRKPSCGFKHSLVLIIFVSLVGVLCGAKDWEEIVQCAEGMIDWISKYVDTSHGIPSSFTLKRVMALIPTPALNRLLECLRSSIQDFKGDVIAFDGKTLRGSRGWNEQDRPLHLLHAWSTEHGLCLGQASVSEKSNEITAVPELIEALEIKGATITADALNTQKTIVAAIVRKGADYVLPVKKNHKDLYDDIEIIFNEADRQEFKGFDAVQTQTLEKSAGRVEERLYDLIDAEDLPEREKWTGCKSIGRVIRKRAKGEKVSTEVCFYITSLELEAEKFSKAVREHWGVENGLHLPLDVVFGEDKHRYQDREGAANLSLLRKISLAILSRDTTLKCGKGSKQMRAATSFAYRDHLLKNCF
jgi:predicted transposase YbfD/YdcC